MPTGPTPATRSRPSSHLASSCRSSSYFEFADNAINPDSMNQYIVKSLFQFKYIYVASAVYLNHGYRDQDDAEREESQAAVV